MNDKFNAHHSIEKIVIGGIFAIPRSTGGYSNAIIIQKLPDEKVRVLFAECGQHKEKIVRISQLRPPLDSVVNCLQIESETTSSFGR
jgi:hypothetical protein